MWRLLNRYNFQIDSNLLIDLKCTICKKIVKDCRQSLCGCRYCCECIEHYLDGQDKICPGSNEECRDQLIDLSRDIQIDHVANMKVSRIVVKCPESDCQHRDELRYIGDHINSHNINCPYFEMGCDKTRLRNINIDDHLKDDGFFHCKLLMNSLHQSRNELNFIKDYSQKRISSLSDTIQNEIGNLRNYNNVQSQVVGKLQTDISTLNKTCISLKKEKEELLRNLENQANAKNSETDIKIAKLKEHFDKELKILEKRNNEKEELVNNLSNQLNAKNAETALKFEKSKSEITNELNALKKSNQEKEANLYQQEQIKNFEIDIKLKKIETNFDRELKSLQKNNKEKEELVKIFSKEGSAKNSEIESKFEKTKTEIIAIINEVNSLKKVNQENELFMKILSQQTETKDAETTSKYNLFNTKITDLSNKFILIAKSIQDNKVLVKNLSQQVDENDTVVQNNYEKSKIEFIALNNELNILKKDIGEKKKLVANLSQLIDAKVAETQTNFEKSKTEINILNNELNMLKRTNQNKEEFVKNLSKQFKEKLEETEIKTQKMNSLISTLSNEMKILKNDNQEKDQTVKALSLQLETKVDNLNNKVQQLKDIADKIEILENSLKQRIAPYLWNVKNFSLKRKYTEESFDTFILSEPFYTTENGYKLCIVVWPNGSQASNFKCLSVGFHLMRGKYDEHLKWPMQCTVTISLIYQDNNTIHSSVEFDYNSTDKNFKGCFHRATLLMRKPRTNTHFININSLMNNTRLYRNDSIILYCRVEDLDDSDQSVTTNED